MVELSEKKKGIEELLEKIPPERRWEITAKFINTFKMLRGEKTVAPLLGSAEGFISPLWSKEKWDEIIEKVIGDGVYVCDIATPLWILRHLNLD